MTGAALLPATRNAMSPTVSFLRRKLPAVATSVTRRDRSQQLGDRPGNRLSLPEQHARPVVQPRANPVGHGAQGTFDGAAFELVTKLIQAVDAKLLVNAQRYFGIETGYRCQLNELGRKRRRAPTPDRRSCLCPRFPGSRR